MTEYDTLADYYDYEWQNLKQDIPFILKQADQIGDPILELASGTGRLTIPLAQRGHRIWALDNSAVMIRIFREKLRVLPNEISRNITLVEDDMTSFSLDQKFRFIFVSFNSFLLLIKKHEQEQCLRSVHKHLDIDGTFIVDIFSPRFDLCAQEKSDIHFLQNFSLPSRKKVVAQWEYVERDMAEQIMEIDFLYEEFDPDGAVERKSRHLTMGIIFCFYMQFMLEKNGFDIIHFYGDYDKSNFTKKSPQMIYVCKKRK